MDQDTNSEGFFTAEENSSEEAQVVPQPDITSEHSEDTMIAPLPSWDAVSEPHNQRTAIISPSLIQELPLVDTKQLLLSFSSEGHFLAIGSSEGMVRIFELSARLQQLISPHPFKTFEHPCLTCLSWAPFKGSNPYEQFLLSGSLEGSVKVWSLDSEVSFFTYMHLTEIYAIACHPQDFGHFSVGGKDKIIRVYNFFNNEMNSLISIQAPQEVTALTYSDDGEILAVGLVKGEVNIYVRWPGKSILHLRGSIRCKNSRGFKSGGRRVTGMTFKDPEHLLVTTLDSRIRIVSINKGKMIAKYKGHKLTEGFAAASLSNDRQRIVCGSENGKVFVWKCYDNELCPLKIRACESYKVHQTRGIENAVYLPQVALRKIKMNTRLHLDEVFVSATSKYSLRVFSVSLCKRT